MSSLDQTHTDMQAAADPGDPRQKRRLVMGVAVWLSSWVLALILVPVINGSGLADGLKATLNTVLVLGLPKLFLVIAIAIMGKPGFAYLKSLIASQFRRLAPPAAVSPLRYRIGLVLFVTLIVLSSAGDYASHVLPLKQQHPQAVAMAGDALLLVSLFLLGGDFWDKLRALFVREAKAVFPAAQD